MNYLIYCGTNRNFKYNFDKKNMHNWLKKEFYIWFNSIDINHKFKLENNNYHFIPLPIHYFSIFILFRYQYDPKKKLVADHLH